MNERIKELADQAGAEHSIDGDFVIFSSPDVEKFAKLIISECVAAHVDNYGIDIISEAIDRHFGIE